MPKSFYYSSEITFGGRYTSCITEEAFSCRDTVISRVKGKTYLIANAFIKEHAPSMYETYFSSFSSTGTIPALFKSDMHVDITIRHASSEMHDVMLHYISQEILPRYNTDINVVTKVVDDPFANSRGVSYRFIGGQDAFAAAWWSILVDRLLTSVPSVPPTIRGLIHGSDSLNKDIWYYSYDQHHHEWMWKNRDSEPEAWRWIFYNDGPYTTSLSADYIDKAVDRIIKNIKAFDLYDLLMGESKCHLILE